MKNQNPNSLLPPQFDELDFAAINLKPQNTVQGDLLSMDKISDEEADFSAVNAISDLDHDDDYDAAEIDWVAVCRQDGEEVDWDAYYSQKIAVEEWPAILAAYGFVFRPTPRILLRRYLRPTILGKFHLLPPHIRGHIVHLSAPADFSSLVYDPQLNRNYYICLRSDAALSGGSDWRVVSEPIAVEGRNGALYGTFSVYQLMDTDVAVKEYRSTELDQREVN